MTLEHTCECGRVYVVPDESEGRKLQCRHCGTLSVVRRAGGRAPAAPLSIAAGAGAPVAQAEAWQSAARTETEGRSDREGRSDPEGRGDRSERPEARPDLRILLRRCPGCGRQDDWTVARCPRCGDGPGAETRAATAAEAPGGAGRGREIFALIGKTEALARLGMFPVVGVAPAVAALAHGVRAGDGLALVPAAVGARLAVRLQAARLLAAGCILGWIGLAAGWATVSSAGPRRLESARGALAERCRLNLAAIGRRVTRSVADEGRFPASPQRSVAEGIDDLVAANGLGSEALVCPVIGGERYGKDTTVRAIDAKTEPGHLLVWDTEAHRNGDGLASFRALRADGTVEELATMRDLEAARERPAARAAGAPPGRPAAHEGGLAAARAAVLALDKELEGARTISSADFAQRVGIAVAGVLERLAESDDLELETAAARVISRLTDLPHEDVLKIGRAFADLPDRELRLALGLALDRWGAPAWLDYVGAVADEALPPLKDQALARLDAEARKGREGLRRVLLQAAERRRLTRAPAERPIFVLSPATFGDAAALLADPDAGAEAATVLGSGGAPAGSALEPCFADPRCQVRAAAFEILLAQLRARGGPVAPRYHERLRAERDPGVKAAGLAPLAEEPDVETLRIALEALRAGWEANGTLEMIARAILARSRGKECAAEIVAELDRAGADRDDVLLLELARPVRRIDPAIGEALLARFGAGASPQGQSTALEVARARFDESAHRLILELATREEVSALVRAQALAVLTEHAGALVEGVRAEARNALVVRLAHEADPRVRVRLVATLGTWEFRSAAGFRALVDTARSPEESLAVRERALDAIASQNDPAAVSAIVEMLDDLPESLREVAAEHLRRLTNGPSLGPLGGAAATSTNEWRRMIASSAGELGKRLAAREEREAAAFNDRRRAASERAAALRVEAAKTP